MTIFKSIAIASALVAGTAATAQEKFITIGTGGQTGVYFVVGQSICRLVNRDSAKTGLKCTAPSTGGSIANINAIKAGDMDMGVAQSDWQFHAYNGSSQFEGDKFDKERAVFSVHAEPFNVIARADSGIESFDDLKGKRVNVGNPGSGQRATMEVVMDAFGMSMDDFTLATEYKGSEMAKQICDDNIDAMIYTIGHPAAAIKEATTTCDVQLVSVTGAAVEKLVADNPYYRVATIPAGMYAGNDSDTTTFGVGATFVTSANVPEEVAYVVAKAVLSNLDDFRGLHPAFANLDAAQMIKDGLSAPLHDGAAKAYKELGLMD
jgi:TRAP transporter TAXI family solute receptor